MHQNCISFRNSVLQNVNKWSLNHSIKSKYLPRTHGGLWCTWLMKGELINMRILLTSYEGIYWCISVSLTFLNVYRATSVWLSVPSATTQQPVSLAGVQAGQQLTLHGGGPSLRLEQQHFRARASVSHHHFLLHQHHSVCYSFKHDTAVPVPLSVPYSFQPEWWSIANAAGSWGAKQTLAT